MTRALFIQAAILVAILLLLRRWRRRPSGRQRVLDVFLRYPDTRWYASDLARIARVAHGSILSQLWLLEQEGWLRSDWEAETTPWDEAGPRPRRRLYWLNPDRPTVERVP
jgi:hypothetical protein